MPFSVSSWFVEQAQSKASTPVRYAIIGDMDVSRDVLKWPRFRKKWDAIRPMPTTLPMANEHQYYNRFREDKTLLRQEASLLYGFRDETYKTSIYDDWSTVNSAAIDGTLIADPNTAAAAYIQTTVQADSLHDTAVTAFVPVNSDTVTQGKLRLYRYTSASSNQYAEMIFGVDTSSYQLSGFNGAEVNTSQTRAALVQIDGTEFYRYHFTVTWSQDSTLVDSCTLSVFPAVSSGFGVEDASITGSLDLAQIAVGVEEAVTVYSGKTERFKFTQGRCEASIVDKFKQLTERVIGTRDNPVTYTGSNYIPADIAWWAITSYGGYSSVKSSNNPDIDYDAWLDWWSVFSSDAVYVNAKFEGIKVGEVLRKIGRMTRSAIHIPQDRITFKRFTLADTYATDLDDAKLLDVSVDVDDKELVNRQYVAADYDTTSDYFATTVMDEDTSSVNSFGLKEDTEDDKAIWYVGSGPALNLAQRIISTNGEPYDKIEARTTLVGMLRQVGETITVTDSFTGITGDGFRIMGLEFDMDKAEIRFQADRSQYFGGFVLDTSTLDGPDILT